MSPRSSPCHRLLRFLLAIVLACTCAAPVLAATGCHVASSEGATPLASTRIADQWRALAEPGSDDWPIPLRLGRASRLVLLVAPGHACHFRLTPQLPGSVTIGVDALSGISALAMALSAVSVEPEVAMAGAPVTTASGATAVRYTLPAVSYRLRITGTPEPGRSSPAAVALSVGDFDDDVPDLAASAASTDILLDPVSHGGFRRYRVERNSLVRFSLPNLPPVGELERQVSLDLLAANGARVLAIERSRGSDGPPSSSYIVKPGGYVIKVDARNSAWLASLPPESARSTPLALHVDTIAPYEVPATMTMLSEWLQETGLGGLLEFVELTDYRHAGRNLPGAYDRHFWSALEVACVRAQRRLRDTTSRRCSWPRFDTDAAAAPIGDDPERLPWPSDSVDAERPVLALNFQVKADRDIMRKTESAFEKAHGTTLWNRLLQKISHLEGVPARSIVIVAPVSCSGGLVYIDEGNVAYRHGWECTSGSSATPLAVAASVSPAAGATLRTGKHGLPNAIPAFMQTFLGEKNASIDYMTLEADYAELIIRGLQGQVIRGGRDWERLQVTLSITGNGPRMLRASVDGRLASGLGSYPADTQFTRDMDVGFKGEVTEYSKRLVTALRDFLEKQR